jgi:prophage DNA circulation protein
MATRIVQIDVKADGGQYEATINRLTESNRRMTRDAVAGTEQVAAAWEKLKNNPAFRQGLMEGMADELRKVTGEAPKVITLTNEMRAPPNSMKNRCSEVVKH